ncbi:MAG: glycogen/starch/alpha-glucan phosphorylase [Candidatus Bathyarchaeia archaeon]
MEESTVVYVTLETDLIDGGGIGGLGILTSDVFHEARRRNSPFYLFSPLYPVKLHQKINNGSVEMERIKINHNSLKKIDSFRLDTKWYPVEVSVYLHELSIENTRSYFIEMAPTEGNGWLKELELYNEKDEGQQVFVRYTFARSIARFLRRNSILPKLYHLNESDTAFLILAVDEEDMKGRFIGNTHTPQLHGHKRFRKETCECLIEDKSLEKLKVGEEEYGDIKFINFGRILAYYSEKLCCVSELHEKVTKECLYPEFKEKITSVTNGISLDWISPHLQNLFNQYIIGWENNSDLLKNLDVIPDSKLLEAHHLNKRELSEQFLEWKRKQEVISNFDEINIDNTIFTCAKRLTEYKRLDHFLKLIDLFPEATFVFAGRPIREWGDKFLKSLIDTIKNSETSIAYVLNHDREKARYMVAGSDVGVNIPVSTSEASGTSWMKTIVNGNILVSTPSGSVPEVITDGKNGLIVHDDLSNLREKLEEAVSFARNGEYAEWIRNSISSSCFVLAPRMFDDYISKLYS